MKVVGSLHVTNNHWWALALIAVLQTALVSLQFPAQELLTEKPILHIDHAYHLYQIEVARRLWDNHEIVGYDPTFAAGHVGGVVLNASAKVPALLAISLEDTTSAVVVYKIYVFIASIIAPLAVHFAARLASLSVWQCLLAGVLGVILWWASYLHWYHTAGMVSYVLSVFLAVAYSALVIRYLSDRSSGWWVGVTLGLLGAVGLLLHPLFPVLVLGMALPGALGVLGSIDFGRTLRKSVLIVAVALLPNLPWLIAMASAQAPYLDAPYQRLVQPSLIVWGALGMVSAHGAKINIALLGASVLAALTTRHAGIRQAGIGLAGWCLLSLLGALGGASEMVAQLQPNRFLPAAYACLLIPATLGISQMWKRPARLHYQQRLVSCVGLTLIILVLGISAAEVLREVTPGQHGRYGDEPPEVDGEGEKVRWLLTTLGGRVAPGERILFETSHGRVHDGAHVAGYLALALEREFIGGPYPYFFQAGSWDGVAFGQAAQAMSPGLLLRYTRLFNVGWAVIHSNELKYLLRSTRSARLHAAEFGLEVYQFESPGGLLLQGRGEVLEAAPGRLSILVPAGESAVMSYQFVRGLHVIDGNAILRPVRLADWKQPWVKIESRSDGPIRLELD